jgi:hypothetical protein
VDRLGNDPEKVAAIGALEEVLIGWGVGIQVPAAAACKVFELSRAGCGRDMLLSLQDRFGMFHSTLSILQFASGLR